MSNINDRRYPKSKSGLQCITPCYPADLWTIHPTTLRYHTSNLPYCHVNLNINSEYENLEVDGCYNPISLKDYSEMDVDILMPLIDFNCKHFLIIFNNIKTYEDGMEYLEKKKYTSPVTRARVVNCLLKVYGENIEIVDQRLVDFFIELVKKKWIVYIYDSIYKYIYADEKIVKFINPNDNYLGYSDYKIERINYIVANFINYDEMYKYINRYIRYRKDTWDNIDNYIESIKNDFVSYIENKINITLEKS